MLCLTPQRSLPMIACSLPGDNALRCHQRTRARQPPAWTRRGPARYRFAHGPGQINKASGLGFCPAPSSGCCPQVRARECLFLLNPSAAFIVRCRRMHAQTSPQNRSQPANGSGAQTFARENISGAQPWVIQVSCATTDSATNAARAFAPPGAMPASVAPHAVAVRIAQSERAALRPRPSCD